MNTPAAVDPKDTTQVRAIVTMQRNNWNWDLRKFREKLGLTSEHDEDEAQRLFGVFRDLNNASREFTAEQLLILLSD